MLAASYKVGDLFCLHFFVILLAAHFHIPQTCFYTLVSTLILLDAHAECYVQLFLTNDSYNRLFIMHTREPKSRDNCE